MKNPDTDWIRNIKVPIRWKLIDSFKLYHVQIHLDTALHGAAKMSIPKWRSDPDCIINSTYKILVSVFPLLHVHI